MNGKVLASHPPIPLLLLLCVGKRAILDYDVKMIMILNDQLIGR